MHGSSAPQAAGDDHPLSARVGISRRALPWARFGRWPTPLTSLTLDGEELWLKREDLSHPLYGGNKLRTLEVLLGDAAARGVTRVWATGAYGSNHVVAALVHGPSAGVNVGALLFPQPYSPTAAENLRSSLSQGSPVVASRNVATLPFAMLATRLREQRVGERPWIMPPGGASPLGTLGACSAIFELAEQLDAGQAPPPARILVPAGSVCTTAGLLLGLAIAHRLGRWRWPRPLVHSVRVTPWPVTSHLRISALAKRGLDLVDRLRGASSGVSRRELGAHLVVDGSQLGSGYGRGTRAGEDASRAFADAGGPVLDPIYSAKAAAALRSQLRSRAEGPLLFWSTKSSAAPPRGPISDVPPPFARWLAQAQR